MAPQRRTSGIGRPHGQAREATRRIGPPVCTMSRMPGAYSLRLLESAVLDGCISGATLVGLVHKIGQPQQEIAEIVERLLSTRKLRVERRPLIYGDRYWAVERTPGLLADSTYREIAAALGEGSTAGEVSTRLGIPLAVIQGALDRLVARGYLVHTSTWGARHYIVNRTSRLDLLPDAPTAPSMDQETSPDHELEWDAFISYASEDREAVVKPVVRALRRRGLRIWYDQLELSVGDSVVESLDRGLARSRCGVIVLSPAFVSKKGFTQWELRGLIERHINGETLLLPILHNIEPEVIRERSPALSDIFAIRSDHGTRTVAATLARKITSHRV